MRQNAKKARSDKNWPLTDMVTDVTTLPSDSPLIYAMASCHSLIKLNGELTGNPLDVKVFESIEWELKVNNELIRSNYASTNLFSPIFLSWKRKKILKCFLRRPQKLTKSSRLIWHYVVSVKSTVKISSFFVAFLENINFKSHIHIL